MEIKLKKNEIFMVKDTKVYVKNDLVLDTEKDKGVFILNFWEQCDYPDIYVFPVKYVPYRSIEDSFELRQDNVIYGSIEDISLIKEGASDV